MITGYRATLDPVATSRACEVIVEVNISANDAEIVTAFESAVAAFDEVVDFRRLLGRLDYLIRVADLAAYEHFVMHRLGPTPALQSIESHQTMKVIKWA